MVPNGRIRCYAPDRTRKPRSSPCGDSLSRTILEASLLALALASVLAGCTERRSEPPKQEEPPARDVSGFLPGHGPDAPAWPPGAPPAPGEGLSRPMPKGPADILSSRGEIAGTVTLAEGERAPERATLYVFVSRPGRPGPPVAVARIPDPRFPQPFRIGASNVIAGALEGELDVGARLDLDGDVDTREPGNLTGAHSRNPVRVGSSGVSIALARAAPQPSAGSSTPPPRRPERGASISGTIDLTPGARTAPGGVLFVIAREGSRETGPPLAAKRIEVAGFPVPYTLSASDAMSPEPVFSGPVSVTARLDADGNASTRGPDDLVGRFARNPATVGDEGVDIRLGPAPAGTP